MINNVYLAGPIDLGKDINWKDALVKKFEENKIPLIVFNPATAFKLVVGESAGMTIEVAEYIEAVNNAALDMADLVICSLPKGVQTIGTIIELDRCRCLNKKVILITDIDVLCSAYLLNRTDPNNIVYVCPDAIDEALGVVAIKVLGMSNQP
jgi:nucleoside 2-deoxyribosyltransferase